jgi:hypothetical protein
MKPFPLCREDPLVSLLYNLFGVNIVRVPDSRIRPLSVIGHRAGRSFYRGSLLPLLSDRSALGILPQESLMTDISGRRSRRVTLDLGIHILRGFLKGFDLPVAGLENGLTGARYLSFAFPAVHRLALDVNALGWALAGRRIDRTNPAAVNFFEKPRYDMLLIDSILTSSNITITLSGSRGQRLNVDIDVLRKLIAELGGEIGVNAEQQVELTLASPHKLTFAFSCVRIFFDEEGLISAIPPDHRQRTLGSTEEPMPVRYSPDRVMLSDGPGLLAWDT